jgi:hypothetical protein
VRLSQLPGVPSSVDMWIDDVAIDGKRTGCVAADPR